MFQIWGQRHKTCHQHGYIKIYCIQLLMRPTEIWHRFAQYWICILYIFIRPSSDGTYYGMVMSVRPSDSPSGSPSASFPHFSPTCFDTLSWNFAYDFLLLYYRSSSSDVNLRQSLWELCPFWNLENWKCSFPHFSLTSFNILSWNFAYDFVLLYYRSSSSVVNLRQFLWELCPFWNLEYWKYTVFRTFLLHAFTYWAEILHMTFFLLYYRSSLSVVNLRQFLWELCPFWNL